MKWIWLHIVPLICLLLRLLRPGGAKSIVSENLILKQQLIVLTRGKKRCPPLNTWDRLLMAFCTLLMTPRRVQRASIAVAGSTLLGFHKALVNKKYSKLFGSKKRAKPGPKGPSKNLIRFIVEMKEKNPGYGCPRIALLASNVLGVSIDEFLVRRILNRHYKPIPGGGPSWLVPIGFAPDKLWSLDFFRLESITLRTHWIMLVMDQYTRRIIGFAVHEGNLTGPSICFMFNKIMMGKTGPDYLSTDNDPLFKFFLWEANLDIYDIEEIKSVPSCPTSHPFIERKIGSCRREFTDRTLFYSKYDLERKFEEYVRYFNEYRVHYALQGKTPSEANNSRKLASVKPGNHKWNPVCGGLFHTPIAA